MKYEVIISNHIVLIFIMHVRESTFSIRGRISSLRLSNLLRCNYYFAILFPIRNIKVTLVSYCIVLNLISVV